MTKKELEKAIDNLNKNYMKSKKNRFSLSSAYGLGYKVVLTGKEKKVGKKYVYYGLRTAEKDVTKGYHKPNETLAQLAILLSDQKEFKRFISKY